MVNSASALTNAESTAWTALQAVTDPEIPVLSVVDLGLVRFIRFDENGQIEVGLSPTYTGCPAMTVIRGAVIASLRAAGFSQPRVTEMLAPPWTSDWLSAEGREKLRRYGIAPPAHPVASPRSLWLQAPAVKCPVCASDATEELSRFGSTPCKALYRCKSCLEPFEYFKCI